MTWLADRFLIICSVYTFMLAALTIGTGPVVVPVLIMLYLHSVPGFVLAGLHAAITLIGVASLIRGEPPS